MVSTFTPNIQWEEPARGDQVGTWDTPVNNNGTLIDRVVGGQVGISLNNSNVVLSAAQFQAKLITFQSTLTGSVVITFPTSFVKSYEIQNLCTGTSAFTITLTTTNPGLVVCAPPGEIVDVVSDGSSFRFKNLGRVGSLMDYAGSSVPSWISGCSAPPFLNCDGTAFSSASFPALTVFLGGTTLPDARGRFRLTLNQGTGRVTTGNGGVDGNTNLAGGGTPNITLVTANLPAYTPSGNIVSSAASQNQGLSVSGGGTIIATPGSGSNYGIPVNSVFTGNAQGGTSQPLLIVNPAYVGGLTLIRSA
jgi:microcystin-dependent protein